MEKSFLNIHVLKKTSHLFYIIFSHNNCQSDCRFFWRKYQKGERKREGDLIRFSEEKDKTEKRHRHLNSVFYDEKEKKSSMVFIIWKPFAKKNRHNKKNIWIGHIKFTTAVTDYREREKNDPYTVWLLLLKTLKFSFWL